MKLIITLAMVVTFTAIAEAREVNASFLHRLAMIESGNDAKAHRKCEDARGCLQIREVLVRDVNRIYGTNYKHDDAYNRAKAFQMCKLYLKHYAKKGDSEEMLIRIWQMGPTGARR